MLINFTWSTISYLPIPAINRSCCVKICYLRYQLSLPWDQPHLLCIVPFSVYVLPKQVHMVFRINTYLFQSNSITFGPAYIGHFWCMYRDAFKNRSCYSAAEACVVSPIYLMLELVVYYYNLVLCIANARIH